MTVRRANESQNIEFSLAAPLPRTKYGHAFEIPRQKVSITINRVETAHHADHWKYLAILPGGPPPGTEKADRLLTHAAPLFAVERLDLSIHRDLGYSSEMAL